MTGRNGTATKDQERLLTLQFGRKRIKYALRFSARKTLAIDVNPDLSVVVTAPKDATDEAICEKIQKRAPWIIQQQRFFENYLPALPPRRYVSGESHRYLGRQYRLRVHAGTTDSVKMARGQLNVYSVDATKKARVKTLVTNWFRQRAQIVFAELFEELVDKASRHCIDAERFEVRRMKNRCFVFYSFCGKLRKKLGCVRL